MLAQQEGVHAHSSEAMLTEKLQHLFSLLPAGVLVLDAQGVITQCNLLAIELLGEPLVNELWLNVIQRSFAPREDDGHEISLHNGKRIRIDTRPLEVEPGQIIVLTDLTETRILQDKLNQQQNLADMGQMTAQLAHQVRTPIASALLYAANIKNSKTDTHKASEYADKIISRLKHLEQQVNDMLVFAKGGSTIMSESSVSDLMRDFVNSAENSLATIDFDMQISPEAATEIVIVNQDALISAMQNIVDNSINAANDKLELKLDVIDRNYSFVDIVFTDNGKGMSKEVRSKVLQPFYTTSAKGTGLGLAVVHAVVKAHYGNLWIESEEGRGTQVGIRLPLFKEGERENVGATDTNC